MVTDPVTGHLLDYGTTTYLPGPLRRYVLARDGQCRAPGCSARAASRLQLDHATSFPAGPSTARNTGALCTTCHQLKTDRRASITDSRPDGSCTWTTGWGQRVVIPAHPYLDEPYLDDPYLDRPVTALPVPAARPRYGEVDAAGPGWTTARPPAFLSGTGRRTAAWPWSGLLLARHGGPVQPRERGPHQWAVVGGPEVGQRSA